MSAGYESGKQWSDNNKLLPSGYFTIRVDILGDTPSVLCAIN